MRASGIGLDSGETLVVNIGADQPIFFSLIQLVFFSAPIDRRQFLDQNISDNLGTQFEKAEEIKKNYFSGAVAFPLMIRAYNYWKTAPNNSWLAQSEITRSLVTYKRLKKGKSPSRMFLAARSLLNQLPEYLSQSQRLDIDYFDPLQAILYRRY